MSALTRYLVKWDDLAYGTQPCWEKAGDSVEVLDYRCTWGIPLRLQRIGQGLENGTDCLEVLRTRQVRVLQGNMVVERGRRGGGSLHTPSSSIPSLGYSDNLGVLSCVESATCKTHINKFQFYINIQCATALALMSLDNISLRKEFGP